MEHTLRPYQLEDINFLSKRYSGACFNEQRTGKTPIALFTMQRKQCNKVLVVCPASIILQWAAEIKKWLNQTASTCINTRTEKERAIKNWTTGYLIISYDSLKETAKSTGFVDKILAAKPDAVILDEAHKIKSRNTQVTKAVFKLSKIQHKLALTATPAPNRAHEIWCILHFLFPNTFRSYWALINDYFEVYEKQIYGLRTFKEIGDFKTPALRLQFQKGLALFATRRTRKEVMPWLPDKNYMSVRLDPTPKQAKYLQELTTYFEIENTDIFTQGTLDRLTAYRQICTCPAALKLPCESAKLLWLKQYLTDYPERRYIIFTKFSSAFPFIGEYIPLPYAQIQGNVSIKKRNEIKEAFQAGRVPVLLAQIDTCCTGLTLDRADTIIFLDEFPPASDIQQAEDRFIATTVEKSKKEHLIVELILQNTYDEELYKLVAANASSIDVINNFNKFLGDKSNATS